MPAETRRTAEDIHTSFTPAVGAGHPPRVGITSPAKTQVHVYAATTEEMVEYREGTVTFQQFPGAVKELARTLLRPGMTFYEVEMVEPGKDLGMKYHLFYWDGRRWAMLGPVWRALR